MAPRLHRCVKFGLCLLVVGNLSALLTYCTVIWFPVYRQRAALSRLPSVENSLRVLQRYQRLPVKTTSNNATFKFGRGLGFLKVHKAASTTTQSMFLRYGWRHNMTFILPYEKNEFGYANILSMTGSLSDKIVLPAPPDRVHDILCHHVLYNRQAWNKYLPAHVPKIGTVRNPFGMFKSMLSYFRPNSVFAIKHKDPVLTYLENPLYYDERDPSTSLLNNRMAIEYGVDSDVIKKRDTARFENYLYKVLDPDFAVVIVVERFDESLVLLKRKLGWSLYDILYLSKNVHALNSGNYITVFETQYANNIENIKKLHKRFSMFDYILYDFFNKRLDLQILQEPQFSEEVQYFKSLLKKTEYFCFKDGLAAFSLLHVHKVEKVLASDRMTVFESRWNEEFHFSKLDCLLMYTGELEFTEAIRHRQYGNVAG